MHDGRARKGPKEEIIWSHDQFVREVQRQLVELESLRKKIDANSDAHESLERLFESNRQLLRKLASYFQAHASAAPVEMHCEKSESRPEYLLAYLQSVLEQPTLLKHLAAQGADSESGQGVSWLVLAVGGGAAAPLLDEKCTHCGKLLVSSILAGAAVVQQEDAWFHHDCEEIGDRYWRPYSLN